MCYIAYYRVSTTKQGQSGLGLEAQQATVEKFAERLGGEVIAAYTDIESGKSNKRVELSKAMEQAKASGATLLIAKLDRLSRDVNFISGLMKADIAFMACDNPHATKLTIHIFAAIAEHEREQISKRTKEALRALKARGEKLGRAENLTAAGRAKGVAAIKQNAHEDKHNRRAAALALALRKAGYNWSQIANQLNSQDYTTRKGKTFQAVQVQRLVERAKATTI
jgi:DNA invertase Pin-like site-specific DNA recombinase